MAFKIGFVANDTPEQGTAGETVSIPQEAEQSRRSVVEVEFPTRNVTLTYYNDRFDLCKGDFVFVDGKMEGLRGRVVEVNYNFKIKLSDYKRVIARADTDVRGRFFMAGSHFVTFGPDLLTKEQVRSWFKASAESEEFVSGTDDSVFHVDHLQDMNVKVEIAQRGHEYYRENRVRYLCINGEEGYAIVEGSEPYEVEFRYHDGEIRGLVCSCFCSFRCKHEFAAMLQLQETLHLIREHYPDEMARSDSFSSVNKGLLFVLALDGKEKGTFTL